MDKTAIAIRLNMLGGQMVRAINRPDIDLRPLTTLERTINDWQAQIYTLERQVREL